MADHDEHAHNDLTNPAMLRDHIHQQHRADMAEGVKIEFDSTAGMREWHEQQHRSAESDHLGWAHWPNLGSLRDHLSGDHGYPADELLGWRSVVQAHREVHNEETRPMGAHGLGHEELLAHVLDEHHYSPMMVPRDNTDELEALHDKIHEAAPEIEKILRESMEEASRTAGIPITSMEEFKHVFGGSPHEPATEYGTITVGGPNLTPGLTAAQYHLSSIEQYLPDVVRRALTLHFQAARKALELIELSVRSYVEQTARPMVITGLDKDTLARFMPDISVGYSKEDWERAGEQMRAEGMEPTPHHTERVAEQSVFTLDPDTRVVLERGLWDGDGWLPITTINQARIGHGVEWRWMSVVINGERFVRGEQAQ